MELEDRNGVHGLRELFLGNKLSTSGLFEWIRMIVGNIMLCFVSF